MIVELKETELLMCHVGRCADAIWGKPIPDYRDGSMHRSLARSLCESPSI